MIKINVICVGSIKEKFFKDAIEEYSKRLSRFCDLKIIEVAEQTNQSSIQKKIELESQKLLDAAKGTLILLDREGEGVSSEKLANLLQNTSLKTGEISLIIGGSNGVSQTLKQKADKSISFGEITFPHQLFRVVLLEQVYRAFTIIANTPYHK